MSNVMRVALNQEAYSWLIQNILELGYQFVGFDDESLDGKQAIMRHDVDLHPSYAEKMAKLEAEMGMFSTYFFLVTSSFYNVLHAPVRQSISNIKAMGHRVGLHFDASLYDQSLSNLEDAANQECKVLENVIGEEVLLISFHRPAKHLQGMEENLSGRIHTYQPRFFNDMEYCSDSGGSWSYGHPLERESFNTGKPIQIVTHPIWWFNDVTSAEPIPKVENFRASADLQMIKELADNLRPYKDFISRVL